MAGPWEQYGGGEPVPQEGYKYGQLPDRVAQTPEEVAQTAQIEERDRGVNLGRVNDELARKGLTDKQKGPLEEERARLMGIVPTANSNTNGPWSQYAAPSETAPAPPAEAPGFLETLRDPRELWTQESLPAHLISAYKKGVFDKPIGELVHNAADAVKDFSVEKLWDSAKANPGQFAGELVNAVVADPYLLLVPGGLGGRLTEALGKIGTVGKLAGQAAEVGIVGGASAAPISAAAQLDKAGFIDPNQLAQDIGVGAGMGAAIGGVLALGGSMIKANPAKLADEVRARTMNGEEPVAATEAALRKGGMEEAQAKDLADELAPYRDEAAAEVAAAKERVASGEAAGYGEEPSALAAREEFLAGKKTLTPSQAKELTDIQTYREVLPELGVEPAAADVMTPSQAKAWVDSKAPDAPLPTAAKAVSPEMAEGTIPKFMTQRGVLDPEMAKWLALGVGGAAIGGYLADDKGKGAAIGAALALGGGIAAKAGRKLVSDGMTKFDEATAKFKSLKRDPAIAKQTDELLSAHEGMTAGIGLASSRLSYAIKELVPDAARRGELIHAIQEGRVRELAPNERAAAELFQKEMAEFGDAGQKMGVLDDLINDGSYVTQLWKDEGKARAYYASMSGKSRFAEDRLIPSYKKGMELGLEPRTLDLAEIAEIYGRSLGKSMANKELIDALKTVKVAGLDARPVMPRAEAPADYVPLPHPQLQGMLVNPEMAPSLSYLFHSNNIPAHLQAAMAVSAAAKQGLFGLSLFHAKSLLEVGLGIGLGLGTPKTLTKIPAMIEMLRKGKAGDFVDDIMRAGLKVDAHGFDMDLSAWARLTNAIIGGLEKIPVAGKVAALPVKGVEKLSGALNDFLWQYLHPAIKLSTANVAYTKALEGEAAKLIKDPSYIAQTPQAIMKEIAGATNDLFGGLDWRAVSAEIENKFLHNLAASRTNPEGLRTLRIALVAPDWLTSTVRAGYKGMKSTAKSAIPGTKLGIAEDMYRRYFLSTGLLVATAMEGLQQYHTGTHFWDNPDPTLVYLPDGRSYSIAKHYTEIFHWMKDPTGTAVNKLGYLPKEAAAQLLSKEYISTKGMPPMEDTSIPGRIVHAGKGMLPIWAQELIEGQPREAVSGAIGVPMRGKSQAEKDAAKRKLAIEISRRRQRQTKRTYR